MDRWSCQVRYNIYKKCQPSFVMDFLINLKSWHFLENNICKINTWMNNKEIMLFFSNRFFCKSKLISSTICFFFVVRENSLYKIILTAQWTRVHLNSNRTDPCAGLCHVRQVPARPYPMQARFQLWWRGRTFYSTRPIIGIFYLPH